METLKFTFTFTSSVAPIADIAYMVYDIVDDFTLFEESFLLEKDNEFFNIDDIHKTIIQPTTIMNLYIKTNNVKIPEMFDNLRYSLSDLKKYFGIQINYTFVHEKLLGIDNKNNQNLCVVCLENEVQIAYETCKHLSVCFSCYSKLQNNRKCVYCRTLNDKIILKKNILNISDYYIP